MFELMNIFVLCQKSMKKCGSRDHFMIAIRLLKFIAQKCPNIEGGVIEDTNSKSWFFNGFYTIYFAVATESLDQPLEDYLEDPLEDPLEESMKEPLGTLWKIL